MVALLSLSIVGVLTYSLGTKKDRVMNQSTLFEQILAMAALNIG